MLLTEYSFGYWIPWHRDERRKVVCRSLAKDRSYLIIITVSISVRDAGDGGTVQAARTLPKT